MFYLYDNRGFVGQIATYGGLVDLSYKMIPALTALLDNGGGGKEMLDNAIKAIAREPGLEYLYKMLSSAEPPVYITDGGADPRIDRFHSEREYFVPSAEDSILSLADAQRVYKKYGGQGL